MSEQREDRSTKKNDPKIDIDFKGQHEMKLKHNMRVCHDQNMQCMGKIFPKHIMHIDHGNFSCITQLNMNDFLKC